MTPLQYIVSQTTPIIQANNPAANPDDCTAVAAQFAQIYLTYILPNLQVDPTTGLVSFVVPAGTSD